MPSEHIPIQLSESTQSEQSQAKLCSDCLGPLTLDAATAMASFFNIVDPTDTALVCNVCRERLRAGIVNFIPPMLPTAPPVTPTVTVLPRQPFHADNSIEPRALQIDTQGLRERPIDQDIDMPHSSPSPPSAQTPQQLYPPKYAHPLASGSPPSRNNPSPKRDLSPPGRSVIHYKSPVESQPSSFARSGSRHPPYVGSSPDPLVDITRLRVRSHGHGCLYPGATFQGTQKSGRNSYDVNVTIVDIDFSSSFLCGYLRIRGLTDDWPELTTYFDAEIIGSRYGFLTQGWGASPEEDMVHWARFPAFKSVQNELQKPRFTMKDRDRGAVFMRWKERFLVPDHRVEDINGASFAGFYYVCVDFNPQPASPYTTRTTSDMPACPETSVSPVGAPLVSPKSEAPSPARRASSATRLRRPPSHASLHPPEEPVATMCGFYFHQNSEPYQQLSLTHVKEDTSSSFEFR